MSDISENSTISENSQHEIPLRKNLKNTENNGALEN